MTEREFRNFNEVEKNKIELDKYYEGERIHEDPGDKYMLEWVQKNAAQFRKEWDESVCKTCFKIKNCKEIFKTDCKNIELY